MVDPLSLGHMFSCPVRSTSLRSIEGLTDMSLKPNQVSHSCDRCDARADDKGAEYQAVVEFAPYQKTPYKAKVKTDTRQGTIDDGALDGYLPSPS